jgi:hypothetical protein
MDGNMEKREEKRGIREGANEGRRGKEKDSGMGGGFDKCDLKFSRLKLKTLQRTDDDESRPKTHNSHTGGTAAE